MTARAFIVGAARSGSGKTSVAIGLMRALARRGLAVRGAKSGPDYIDPGFHAAATGAPGVNLDSWAMPPAFLGALAAGQAEAADVLVVESAMGLFDGVPAAPGRSGAAADLARAWGVPVLLVLDVSGQSQTAAAIARGFATHDPAVRIAGVVLNQVASDRHERLCRAAVEALGLPVVGAVHRNPDMGLPERHLGLVQAREHAALDAFVDRLADVMGRSIDLDAVLDLAAPLAASGTAAAALPPPGQRIALADDAAFAFVYPHVLRGWRAAGAEIVPFSPLANDAPDPSCDICWLPGGYPELHAGRIAEAEAFLGGLRRFAVTKPVHGECGGFMVLGRALEDADGVTHAMAGLLGQVTSFAKRKMNLGYRQARLLAPAPLGPAGACIRGHEFHYSRVTEAGDDAPLAELADGEGRPLGPSGARRGTVTGTFFHAIAGSEPMLEIDVIGIGTGNPEHMTVEAIRALNAADLVLVPRKGAAKADLAELRLAICDRFLDNPATRVVEFDMPVRDASDGYRAGVDAWHREIAARYRALLSTETGTAALLVWGDPSLYDSTLRVLDLLAQGGLAFVRRVIPGITSLQALAARHAVALNAIGGAVEITTGRRLAEAVPDAESVAVLLDGDCAFRGIDPAGVTIYWGAYLGMPNEIAIAGPLAEVADRIATVRAEARAANGWIMDAYLLQREPGAR